MDNIIINNWNNVVAHKDTVYHLGDFGDYDVSKLLNGKIVLLCGNYEMDDLWYCYIGYKFVKSLGRKEIN